MDSCLLQPPVLGAAAATACGAAAAGGSAERMCLLLSAACADSTSAAIFGRPGCLQQRQLPGKCSAVLTAALQQLLPGEGEAEGGEQLPEAVFDTLLELGQATARPPTRSQETCKASMTAAASGMAAAASVTAPLCSKPARQQALAASAPLPADLPKTPVAAPLLPAAVAAAELTPDRISLHAAAAAAGSHQGQCPASSGRGTAAARHPHSGNRLPRPAAAPAEVAAAAPAAATAKATAGQVTATAAAGAGSSAAGVPQGVPLVSDLDFFIKLQRPACPTTSIGGAGTAGGKRCAAQQLQRQPAKRARSVVADPSIADAGAAARAQAARDSAAAAMVPKQSPAGPAVEELQLPRAIAELLQQLDRCRYSIVASMTPGAAANALEVRCRHLSLPCAAFLACSRRTLKTWCPHPCFLHVPCCHLTAIITRSRMWCAPMPPSHSPAALF